MKKSKLSFGESLAAFRKKYQLDELGLNPERNLGKGARVLLNSQSMKYS